MKDKKIKIQYAIYGNQRYEKTELKGIKEGETFFLGNKSRDAIKVEEINNEYCILILKSQQLKVQSDKCEYIDIIEKDEENRDIKLKAYRISAGINEKISFGTYIMPSPTYEIKIISIYEEERKFWK